VIPYVVEVLKDKRPSGAKKVTAPKKCPECSTALEREAVPEERAIYRCVNTDCDAFFERKKVRADKLPKDCPVCGKEVEVLDAGIEIFCPNPVCPGRMKEAIRYFCGRTQMDIEGIGDVLVDQLVERGLVKTFADLYRLKEDDIAGITSEVEQDGKTVTRTVGEKIAGKVVENIAASRDRGLDRLLAGMGIPHVGTRVAFILAQNFGSLESLAAASEAELSNVDEIGEVIAKSVHDFFHGESGREIVSDLKKVGVDPKMEIVTKDAAGGGKLPFAGMSIVVTGTLEKFKREEIEEMIQKLGGRASGSVSKKTAFLVAGADAGSKLEKAKSLGVEVITEGEFVKRAGV
jgi:DNA ligase (NAD+)